MAIIAQTIETLGRQRRGVEQKIRAIETVVNTFTSSTTLVALDFRLNELENLKKRLSTLSDGVSNLCIDQAAYGPAIKDYDDNLDLLLAVEQKIIDLKGKLPQPTGSHATSKVQKRLDYLNYIFLRSLVIV